MREFGSIRLALLIQSVCIAIAIVVFIGFSFVKKPDQGLTVVRNDFHGNDFHECINDTRSLMRIDISDFNNYLAIWNLCNQQIYEILSNDDFSIRREKYRQQELDERVNLWLVVFITLSGVVLSGVQLAISYNLAAAGKERWSDNTEFAIEQGKLSFRSSITGLVILALSLIFFFVYVKWIYSVQEEGRNLASPVPISGMPPTSQNGIGTNPEKKPLEHPPGDTPTSR
jgi:hypothetical protein